MLMIGIDKNLGYRQSSHKLNKRQFKAGCGYKEVSVKSKGYGMAKDRFEGESSSNKTSLPSYRAKTYKAFYNK